MGRDLFATNNAPIGRNLFAAEDEPEQQPQVEAAAQAPFPFDPVDLSPEATAQHQGKTIGAVNQFMQGATFGFAEEIQAALSVVKILQQGGIPEGISTKDLYKYVRDEMRNKNKEFSEQNPGTALAANIVGGVATGGGLAKGASKLISGGASTLSKMAAGSGVGAVEGAAYGAGVSEGETIGEVAGDAAEGAAMGAAGGAVVAGGLSWAQKIAAKKSALTNLTKNSPDARTVAQKIDAAGNLVDDKAAQAAVKQGIDPPFIADIKSYSAADKSKARQMVNTLKKGQRSTRAAALNRPSDVVGDSVMARFNHVAKANRRAAGQLDNEALKLKGQQVNVSGVVDDFLSELESIGVKLDDNLKPVYQNSDLEGIKGGQKVVNNIVNRMRNTKSPDAYDVHRLKKFIDENVSYGKSKGGLTGNAERMVKRLRHDLDSMLDDAFPGYDKINSVYAQTRGALDDFQKAIGTTIDLSSDRASKAVGTASRTSLSNAKGRARVLDAIEGLDSTAKSAGGQFDDDIVNQIVFVDELENLFGASAQTSLQGEAGKAVANAARKGGFEHGLDIASGAIEKLWGVSEEKKLHALRVLLLD